jgi:hypothetical protein
MSRLLGLLARGRALPWLTILQVGRRIYATGRGGWASLSPRDRQELGRLVRKARRGPGALTPGERADLRRIVTHAARGAALHRHR